MCGRSRVNTSERVLACRFIHNALHYPNVCVDQSTNSDSQCARFTPSMHSYKNVQTVTTSTRFATEHWIDAKLLLRSEAPYSKTDSKPHPCLCQIKNLLAKIAFFQVQEAEAPAPRKEASNEQPHHPSSQQ